LTTHDTYTITGGLPSFDQRADTLRALVAFLVVLGARISKQRKGFSGRAITYQVSLREPS